jgi:anthranilate phosphoribosyltransferase
VIQELTQKLEAKHDLTREEARAAMDGLLSGAVPDAHIIAFLGALRAKGEQPAELVGFAEVMRARAAEHLRAVGATLDGLAGEVLLDTCGTGGDCQGTVNISTATAIVVAAAGVRVAKHGNRSISSRCGSADVLEALGVAIDLPLERIPECLERVGMVFLFAPHLHLAMKHVMNARRILKSKTVFNLLGPLTNPLGASVQLLGVYDRARTEMMARALATVGTRRAMVVAGWDGLDEISTTGPTQISETDGRDVRRAKSLPKILESAAPPPMRCAAAILPPMPTCCGAFLKAKPATTEMLLWPMPRRPLWQRARQRISWMGSRRRPAPSIRAPRAERSPHLLILPGSTAGRAHTTGQKRQALSFRQNSPD